MDYMIGEIEIRIGKQTVLVEVCIPENHPNPISVLYWQVNRTMLVNHSTILN